MSAEFSNNQFAFRSLRFYRGITVSIALGVAIAATVITGALLVGDSMRGSLRALTIDRLGDIDQMIIPGGFFNVADIPPTIASRDVIPITLFSPGVLEASTAANATTRRASNIQVIGIDRSFRQLDPIGVLPKQEIGKDEVVLNRAAADELDVKVGDQVTVRLPSEQAVPADSPLGKRESQTAGLPRLKVVAVIDNRGLGRFALHPSQVEPLTAFLNREAIADVLDRPRQANALLISQAAEAKTNSDLDSSVEWLQAMPLRLADFGLKLSRVTRDFEPKDGSSLTVFDYYQLTSDRLLLPQAAVEQLVKNFGGEHSPQLVLTYLANAIERVDENGKMTASVPYSILTAINDSQSLPLDYQQQTAQEVADSSVVPIVLNNWTSDALSAAIGDRLRIAFYEPEVQQGREIERSFDAVLTGIVPITKPIKPYRRNRSNEFDSPPTVYNDPNLTPSVPGVTDQDSISDWDLPFKIDREISSADDQYWAEHRLTPKAFTPLEAGQRLFGSRFGNTTSIRFPVDTATSVAELEEQVLASLLPIRDKLGWAPIMIRDSQLASSRGTTPFDALFLSLSLFVILAAVMLISLLYRLGMLQRGREYGLLMAIGWGGRDVSWLAIREGLWSSLPGILLGLIGGLGYAALVLAGLRSWWVGAVTVPFLEFHWTIRSLLIGGMATLFVAVMTIWLTARRLRNATAQSLLAGQVEHASHQWSPKRFGSVQWYTAIGLLVLAGAALIFGARGSGLAQAGAFVGAGMLLLMATLTLIHRRLRNPNARHKQNVAPERTTRFTLFKMSASNLRRNPLRSTLAIGLMAVATFLIVSIGAFELRPTAAGVGGFDLLAKTATPLYRDINDPLVQNELLGQDRESIRGSKIVSMRVREGQDASCNNLYQAVRPQVLSVPASLSDPADRVAFEWAAFDEQGLSSPAQSPWQLLSQPAVGTEADPIPVVLDQNTAMWSLQMQRGVGEIRSFAWTENQPVFFRVVGLLSNSVLQGSLLIGEHNFKQVFPDVSGYQFFLIATDEPKRTTEVLENRLSDIGMDVSDSAVVLSRLMAVQNTYLKTFQSLGALGLLLGTFGLAIVQLRSALERQSELAVLRAIGFSRSRLGLAVMMETVSLLIAGIGCGLFCSAIAIAPQAIVGQILPPISQPLIAITFITAVGLIAGLVTVTRVAQMPLIEAIRR